MNQQSLPFDLGLRTFDGNSIERIGRAIQMGVNGFVYLTRGQLEFLSEERPVCLAEGSLYIYPPYSHIQITGYTHDLAGVVGVADFDFIQEVLNLTGDTRSHILLMSDPVAELDGQPRRSFENLLQVVLDSESYAVDKVGRLCLHVLGEALCYRIIQIIFSKQRVEPEPKTRADAVFDRFIRHLHEHFRTHRQVQYYADLQCLSTRYFASLVRRRSGRTPCEWISSMVLNEAKRLLGDPDKSIKQIAAELSFANQSFFGSFFRQQAGCSPSAWRAGRRAASDGTARAVPAKNQAAK